VINAILIILYAIKYITQLITITFKSYVKLMIKLLFFSVLFYNVIEVTKEYFSYPYVYRLSVKPSERLDLPPITVCTERHMFFDKSRINRYFNVSLESNKQQVNNEISKYLKMCTNTKMEFIDCIQITDFVIYNYVINQFYWEYQNKLLTTYTFSELYNRFTIKSNELIKCLAKLHSKHNNSSDSHVMTDCSQSYAVLETIYGNKDFGICFTYFYTNTDNQYLIDDDFVQFDINYETQQKFLINGYYDREYAGYDLKLYFDDYFRFYIFMKPLNPSHMVSPDEWIHTKRIGLNARLKITTTHFHLLSNPYMKRCLENGIYLQY